MSSRRRFEVSFDEKAVDAIFSTYNQCHLPGLAVGIAIRGKPVYRKGFGLASLELPIVLTPATRIRIGSTSKHFTCLAYMLLCEEGLAGIDDRLGKHLPEVHPVARDVTMRQIMGNISGLRDVMGIRSQFSGHIGVALPQVSTAELLSLYQSIDDLNASPGTTYIYNNGGFGLLAVVIERITGQSFEQVMMQRVFEALGMFDSLIRRWDTDFVSNSATGHDVYLTGGAFSRAYYGFSYDGAGAVVSNVNDMLRWLINMDTHVIGNAATWATMQTPQRLVNGTSTGYGLGLCNTPYRGVDTIHHAGSWVGTNAQMLKVPSVGLDVIVMANRDDVSSGALVERILDVCIKDLDPLQPPVQGPPVVGTFRSPRTNRVVQLWSDDGNQLGAIDGIDMRFELEREGVLRVTGKSSKRLILVGEPTKPSSIKLSDFGNVDELVAVRPLNSADARGIVGCYRSEATGTDAVIADAPEGPSMKVIGRFGRKEFRLECLGEATWRTAPMDFSSGILTFERDGGVFRFSDCGTRALPFRRVTGL